LKWLAKMLLPESEYLSLVMLAVIQQVEKK